MFSLDHPLNIQVELTEACNHQCLYCYNYWRPQNKNRDMLPEQADKLVEIITQDIKPFHITLTGGEPLLNKKSTYRLAKGLKKAGFFYNLNTNLILLNQQTLEELVEYSSGGKFGILTSLPCFKKETYTKITQKDDLSIFYKNLKFIQENTNLPVTVNMVVNQLNKDVVFEEGKFLFEKYNVKNFAATPVILPPYKISSSSLALTNKQIVKVLDNLLNLNKKFDISVDSLETLPRCVMPEEMRCNDLQIFNRACSAGRSTLSIGYNGDIRACSHMPIVSGNIFKEGFREIWNSFKPFRKNQYVPNECKECTEFFSCYGGCRVYSYKEETSLYNKDPRMVGKITKPKLVKKSLSFINLSKEYAFNKNTIYRLERKGLYTFFNGNFSNVLFANDSFKTFIEYLKSEKIIIPKKLYIKSKNKEKLESLLKVLISKKYLI